MLKRLYDALASLTFGLWLLAGVCIVMAAGSFVTGEGSAINEVPLFVWLREAPPGETWWLWLTLAVLVLLVINTLFCSFESLRAKWQHGSFLVRIAPQVMHLGFLLIVLAHLFSASGSLKESLQVREGMTIGFPGGARLEVAALAATYGKMGMPTDMGATLRYVEGGTARSATISPNHPLFIQGVGIYLKDVALVPYRACLIEIHKEPGAGAALAGAVLVTLANVVLLVKRRGRKSGTGD